MLIKSNSKSDDGDGASNIVVMYSIYHHDYNYLTRSSVDEVLLARASLRLISLNHVNEC